MDTDSLPFFLSDVKVTQHDSETEPPQPLSPYLGHSRSKHLLVMHENNTEKHLLHVVFLHL